MGAVKVGFHEARFGAAGRGSLARGIVLAAAWAVLLGGARAAVGSSPPGQPEAAPAAAASRVAAGGTLSSQGGRVTVTVNWDGMAQAWGEALSVAFRVVMDTHSVNLDAYDLLTLALLRNDRGESVRPASWEAPPGGHHRRGALTFTVPAGFVAGARYVELVVSDVAGVAERTFRWPVGVSS